MCVSTRIRHLCGTHSHLPAGSGGARGSSAAQNAVWVMGSIAQGEYAYAAHVQDSPTPIVISLLRGVECGDAVDTPGK